MQLLPSFLACSLVCSRVFLYQLARVFSSPRVLGKRHVVQARRVLPGHDGLHARHDPRGAYGQAPCRRVLHRALRCLRVSVSTKSAVCVRILFCCGCARMCVCVSFDFSLCPHRDTNTHALLHRQTRFKQVVALR